MVAAEDDRAVRDELLEVVDLAPGGLDDGRLRLEEEEVRPERGEALVELRLGQALGDAVEPEDLVALAL